MQFITRKYFWSTYELADSFKIQFQGLEDLVWVGDMDWWKSEQTADTEGVELQTSLVNDMAHCNILMEFQSLFCFTDNLINTWYQACLVLSSLDKVQLDHVSIFTGKIRAGQPVFFLYSICDATIADHMSLVKRICVFEHSVMTNFNCACPAIQWGQGSSFLSEGSSWLTAWMSEQRRFWRDCADAQARLNLRWSHRL